MYGAFQPFEVPTLDELIEGEMIIDINWPVEDDKDNEKTIKLEWCQGKVTVIVTRDTPTVLVVWDAMLDADDFELDEVCCWSQPSVKRKSSAAGERTLISNCMIIIIMRMIVWLK